MLSCWIQFHDDDDELKDHTKTDDLLIDKAITF